MILSQLTRFIFFRLKLICGSYQSLLALFVLPPLLVVLTGQVMHEAVNPTDVPVAVADLDKSDYSLTVVDRVAENPMVSVTETGEEEARRQVASGEKEVAFIIELGFMDQIKSHDLEGIVTVVRSPSSMLTEMLSEIIAGEVIRLTSNVAAADMVMERYRQYSVSAADSGDMLWQQVWEHTDSQWEPSPLVQLDAYYPGTAGEEKGVFEEDERSEANNLLFMLGMLTVLMMFLVIFLNGWLVSDKSEGLWSRLKSSAVSINLYAAGGSLAVLIAVMASALLSLWLGSVLLPVASVFSAQLLVLFFFYLLSCLGLAWLLAAFAQTNGQLQVMGILVVILTGVFGGIFFHLGELNPQLELAIKFMPQSWVLAGAREFLFSRQDWGAVAQPAAALSLFFVIFLGLSTKVGNRND